MDLPIRACTNQVEKSFRIKLNSDGVIDKYVLC